MKHDLKFQRVARVVPARLLETYGQEAPDQLRRVADRLQALARDEPKREGRYSALSRTVPWRDAESGCGQGISGGS